MRAINARVTRLETAQESSKGGPYGEGLAALLAEARRHPPPTREAWTDEDAPTGLAGVLAQMQRPDTGP